MTLAFILAVPLIALPALGAAAHEAGHKPAHHRVADFAKAKALLSPAPPVLSPAPLVPRTLETDGLSRKDEDCNRGGCIDH